MSSIKKLISQTAVYGLSAVLGKSLNFFLTPFLTRIMLEGVYGQVSYFYALIPFANVLLTMGMTTAFFRYVNLAQTMDSKRELFMTLWISISAFALILCGTGALIMDDILWTAVFALIAVDNIVAMPLGALRAQGRAGYYTVVNLTGIVLNVVLCIVFYTTIEGASSSPLWVIVANLAASMASLAIALPGVRSFFARTFSWRVAKSVVSYSLPLLAAGVLGISSDFIDRQMLLWILPDGQGMEAVGIYGSVGKLASLMIIFRQVYSLGAEPFFLQRFSKDDFARLNSVSLKLFTAAGLLIFLTITLFSDLFGLLLGRSFRVGLDILPLLLLANLFSGLLINLSFWYKTADKTRVAIWITATGLLFTVATNIILIPLMGYEGSAVARVVATLATVVVSWALGQKYYPVKYDLRRIGLYFLIAAAIYTLSIFTASFEAVWRWSADFLLILSFTAFVNHKERLIVWNKKLKS